MNSKDEPDSKKSKSGTSASKTEETKSASKPSRRKKGKKSTTRRTSTTRIKRRASRRRTPKTADRKIAIFSDIHSNLEALEAVMRDMKEQGVTDHICLGDIVGYNANPAECLKIVRDLKCPVIRGNHDEESARHSDLSYYRELARVSMAYSRDALTDDDKAYMKALPLVLNIDDFIVVHSSLFKPQDFYYVDGLLEAEFHFSQQSRQVCFCGHTHLAGVFSRTWRQLDLLHPESLDLKQGVRYLINVGSVGQPRDRDWRSSYCIFQPEASKLEFRRVEYDVEAAQKKINAAGLPAALGERLLVGV